VRAVTTGRVTAGMRDPMKLPRAPGCGRHRAAALFAISPDMLGCCANKLFRLPAPRCDAVHAVLIKWARAARRTAGGIPLCVRFFRLRHYPLLFAIGVALTPCRLYPAFACPSCSPSWPGCFPWSARVCVGKWVNLYPIDTAIVNACHSGQEGPATSPSSPPANRCN